MKKLLFVLLLLSISCFSQTPRAGGINNGQSSLLFSVQENFVGIQPTNANAFAVYNFATSFDYYLGLKNSDNISEGALNRYFSNSLARNAFSSGTGLNYSAGIYSLDSSVLGTLSSVSNKLNIPTGTVSQVLDGLGNPKDLIIPIANNYTAGNGIVITGTAPNLTISVVQPTVTVVTSKLLNSNFTISTTKPAIVSYAVSCTVTNPLLVGTSTATAYLEYSLNSGTTWLTPSQSGNSSGVGVTVAIQLTNTQTGTLTGVIPANALVRIRTATTGTASVNYVTGTEITY